MKNFTFLAAIVLYLLAFMEWDPPKHAAYTKLGLDLGELEEKLKDLKRKISNQTTTTTEVDEKFIDRIEKFVNEVKDANSNYAGKAKQEIETSTTIEESVGEAKKLIDEFYPKNLYSRDALNALMDKIEMIWKEQIQVTVNRAMDEN